MLERSDIKLLKFKNKIKDQNIFINMSIIYKFNIILAGEFKISTIFYFLIYMFLWYFNLIQWACIIFIIKEKGNEWGTMWI